VAYCNTNIKLAVFEKTTEENKSIRRRMEKIKLLRLSLIFTSPLTELLKPHRNRSKELSAPQRVIKNHIFLLKVGTEGETKRLIKE
jgi:hypothetical protein